MMRRGCLVCTTHTFGDLGGGKKTKGETVNLKKRNGLTAEEFCKYVDKLKCVPNG